MLGVVTVTYNSSPVLDDFLRSTLQQSYSGFRLYVVDNASSDGTLKRLARHRDARIVPIPNGANLGFAEGTNQGIKAALKDGCGAVLLINNDTEFDTDLFSKLLACLEESGCDMVAPKILFHDRPQIIWSAGGGFNPWKGYSGFHYGFGKLDRGQYDQPCLVDHAPACCLLVRSKVFAQIGLLDESYFVYTEDTDFCFRAKQAGCTILYSPSATLLHKASTLTGGRNSAFTVRHLVRNQTYFMLKHFGLWRTLLYAPIFEFYQLFKLLSRNIDRQSFFLRQRAFLEAFQLRKQNRLPIVRQS